VREVSEAPTPRQLSFRTHDGTFNDLKQPGMGSYGCRFGRNIPLKHTYPAHSEILNPNPREVSLKLLTRDKLIAATSVNALVAAWLQFEVHDWFSHGKNQVEDPWKIDLGEDDAWHEHPMQIPRTRKDPSYDPASGDPPTYTTDDSHWWDGSQIYGSDPKLAAALRSGDMGKIKIDEDGLLPAELERHLDLSGVAGNFWVGLGMLHTLFSLEHNAICEKLASENRSWSDDEIYDRARLINAALMAKIHTVEWTPAVISHPTTRLAMNANWWGLAGEKLHKRFGRISKSEVISGIPGSETDHHGVPYSLTEEFTAVYRMHPLLPDDYSFRSLEDDRVLAELTFNDLTALKVRERLQEFGMPNSLYSFGRLHPGVVTMHNYPRFLQRFEKPDGDIIDLAATDILRNRERGVPRYNEFRRLVHTKPATSFDELTDNPEWARQIEDVYGGDIDKVDMMIGAYAEPLPKGFAFSDTAFRIFILMASRRLKSDRFFTTDYTPRLYTETGLRWIADNTMISVLLRHYPELAPALEGLENGFSSWNAVVR
jgi:hypothetical protein